MALGRRSLSRALDHFRILVFARIGAFYAACCNLAKRLGSGCRARIRDLRNLRSFERLGRSAQCQRTLPLLFLLAAVRIFGVAQLSFHLELEVVRRLAELVHQLADLAPNSGSRRGPKTTSASIYRISESAMPRFAT